MAAVNETWMNFYQYLDYYREYFDEILHMYSIL